MSNLVSFLIMIKVFILRVCEVLKDKLPIIDVDSLYLPRKEQKLNSQGVKTFPMPNEVHVTYMLTDTGM